MFYDPLGLPQPITQETLLDTFTQRNLSEIKVFLNLLNLKGDLTINIKNFCINKILQ